MPLPRARLIRYELLQSPRDQLGVLVEPPASALSALVRRGVECDPGAQATGDRWDAGYDRTPILDTTLAALRAQLRQRLELAGPVILTGHQAEFIHAGVLAKTIAVHALARQHGGQAVFLAVDSDTPKTTRLPVPQLTAAGVRRVEVDIPGCNPRRPYESHPAVPREHWLEFFTRVASLHAFYDRSLLRSFADGWLASDEPLPEYSAALARGRAATEKELGLDGVHELRMSRLCPTPEFRAFAAHLLLNAPHCAEHYNAAQAAYRRRHRVRSAARPAPPLAVSGDTCEVPLWVYRPDEPRRRLYVAPRGGTLDLSADGVLIGRMSGSQLERADAHRAPWPLERDGWQLRPRALTLSAFFRLLLADLFIHGIGGAKYDEMMEDFVRGFLGVNPGPMGCVTATVRLLLPVSGVRNEDIAAARQRGRDLRFNPQRHLQRLPQELVRRRAELVRRSDELRHGYAQDHGARRLVFAEIRRVNEKMLRTDPWRPAEYDRQLESLLEKQRLDRIALDREYFYALHTRDALEGLVRAVRREMGAP